MFRNPDAAQLQEIARKLGLSAAPDYLEKVSNILEPLSASCNDLDSLPDHIPNRPNRPAAGVRPVPDASLAPIAGHTA